MIVNSIVCRLIVSGHVQGVSFRAFVCERAKTLKIDGFVRNRRNGTVEALVKGEAANVQAIIDACHQGPAAARVDNVEITEAQGIVEKGFRQLPTV